MPAVCGAFTVCAAISKVNPYTQRLCGRLLVPEGNQFGKPGGRAPRQSGWILGNKQQSVTKACASPTKPLCVPQQAEHLQKQGCLPASKDAFNASMAQHCSLGCVAQRLQLACSPGVVFAEW